VVADIREPVEFTVGTVETNRRVDTSPAEGRYRGL
jgi:hypothetical protein